MKIRLLTVQICYEHDVVLSRQRAREIASLLGFNSQDHVRIATAVSEIARNAFRYAGGGRVEFFIDRELQPFLHIVVTDQGRGISNLATILEGKYKSRTGMGLGIIGTKRLMDGFEIESGPQGTKVVLEKRIENGAHEFNQAFFAHLTEELSRRQSQDPFHEVQQQNQELLTAFTELERRETELRRLNRQLEEVQGQLSVQNQQLEQRVAERTAELKNSLQEMEGFCYSIAHDLKAPLRAISSFTRVLTEDYTSGFDMAGIALADRIINASTRMDTLVADLLEYGQLTHMDVPFSEMDLNVETKRAMEYLAGEIVSTKGLVEVQHNMPKVIANPTLLQQVLRNLVENGLKFTKLGVRPHLKISAEPVPSATEETDPSPMIKLCIKDDGIGILPVYNDRIFKVFERLHLATDYPGNGIGLALVQKAVERMKGTVGVESLPDEGCLFWVQLPAAKPISHLPHGVGVPLESM
jgi:signal transduction histidine kinase